MSPVQNVVRQLVQRRLWPVAILLVAALAAVPMMLAKDPEPPLAPPAPAADNSEGELASQPIVALTEAGSDAKRRKVLGSAKNPFRIDPPKTEEPADSAPADEPAPADGQPDPAGSGGAPVGGGTDVSIPPSDSGPALPEAPTEPAPPPKKQYEPHELTVRFATGEDGGERKSLKRLEPLPTAELPVLIYLGVTKDGKAEFLLEAGVETIGDGECHPSPEACETIRLSEGETEFLDVKDEAGTVVEQYQLDVIEIHKGSGATASKAKKAKKAKKAAKAARSELRSVTGRTSAFLP
jgi:hypothetical protein